MARRAGGVIVARIQILNLPGDGQPFALIIDQATDIYAVAEVIKASDAVCRLGARSILAFEETVEIVQPQPTAASAPDWYTKIGAIPASAASNSDEAKPAAPTATAITCQFCERDCKGAWQSWQHHGGGIYTCTRCLDWQAKIRVERDCWERAADRNGQLYSACENQRDDARQGLTDLRARMTRLADKLDDDADGFGGGKYQGWQEAAEQIRKCLDGASIGT